MTVKDQVVAGAALNPGRADGFRNNPGNLLGGIIISTIAYKPHAKTRWWLATKASLSCT